MYLSKVQYGTKLCKQTGCTLTIARERVHRASVVARHKWLNGVADESWLTRQVPGAIRRAGVSGWPLMVQQPSGAVHAVLVSHWHRDRANVHSFAERSV
jgi:hypothetical protein